MARRGVPNEDLSNIEFETSEEVEVVPTFNSMVCTLSINCCKCICIHFTVIRAKIPIILIAIYFCVIHCRAYVRNFFVQFMLTVSIE